MRTIASAVFLVLVAGCSTQPAQTTDRVFVPSPMVDAGTLVRCESNNNTRQTCRVDARTRMVAVNQQLSENPCIYGRSWGLSSGRDEIWVDNGCRGEFQVGGATVAGTAFGRSVICESQNNGRAQCAADTSYGVQLVRQISSKDCRRGSDWGFTENGIWVDNGCRAEFVLAGEQRFQPMTSSAQQRVVCESQNNSPARCAADTYWGVTLARQISNNACMRGRTWGYDAGGIWVSGGCRAEFVVGF